MCLGNNDSKKIITLIQTFPPENFLLNGVSQLTKLILNYTNTEILTNKKFVSFSGILDEIYLSFFAISEKRENIFCPNKMFALDSIADIKVT